MSFDEQPHGPDFFISTDKKLLSTRWLVANLLAQSWASCWTHERLAEAVANSLTFGVYHKPNIYSPDVMVGFGRAVTDGCTYSLIADIVIGEAYQRRGLGKFLVSTIVSHPSVVGTVCVLRTNSPAAAAIYSRFGFAQVTAMRRIPA